MKTKTATARAARGLPTGQRPRVIISTDQVDSERDRVVQAGLTFRERLRVTFAHSYHALPVGLVTGIDRFPHRTEAEFEWFEGDPEVAKVRNIYNQLGLDASIGFQVEEAAPNELGGHDILRARVVEFALVPVPANEGAMALAKSLGVGRGDVDLNDDVGLEAIPYDAREVERQRRWASLPADGEVLAIDGEDVLRNLARRDVIAAVEATMPQILTEAVIGMRRALDLARGRID